MTSHQSRLLIGQNNTEMFRFPSDCSCFGTRYELYISIIFLCMSLFVTFYSKNICKHDQKYFNVIQGEKHINFEGHTVCTQFTFLMSKMSNSCRNVNLKLLL